MQITDFDGMGCLQLLRYLILMKEITSWIVFRDIYEPIAHCSLENFITSVLPDTINLHCSDLTLTMNSVHVSLVQS